MTFHPAKKINEVITKEDLTAALKQLGVEEGMTLEVHTSLSSFGFVVGGAQTVVDALLESVGYEGTVAMPMQNAQNTDPSAWVNPPIVHELQQVIRDHMPPYNRRESDTDHMGAVVENMRRREGVAISFSPSLAYVAWGKYAKLICGRQPLHFPLGESSPTAHLYDVDGYALLLGVPYRNCTALHLAEYRSGVRPIITNGGAVEMGGQRVWKKYLDIETDADVFDEAGELMEKFLDIHKMKIGNADCLLFSIKEAVDFLSQYLQNEI